MWRLLSLLQIIFGMFLTLALNSSPALLAAPVAQSESAIIYVLTFEGVVTPVLHQYIQEGIEIAIENKAEALILQLDTPGGSVNVTKSITQEMLTSPVPIIVYVAPTGAHAGSAGTFITLAGHVAVMAPGSSIGAASPVGGGGEDIDETMKAKIVNILSADIENLASRRGEAATEWAIAAVQDASAATSQEALELGVIDFIAADLATLLEEIDGFEVIVQGEPHTLETEKSFISRLDLSPIQEFLNFIANPTIATLLLTIGSLGLFTEIRNPGMWIPGIVGAVCLLLGLYALGQLEANFAGVALIGIAIILLIAELFTPTFGLLTAAGTGIFILGAALLFDTPGIHIPWLTIITLALGLGGFSLVAGGMGLAAQRRPVRTGMEGLIGLTGRVKAGKQESVLLTGERGSILVAGEWWNAEVRQGVLHEGDEAKVVGRKGYTLIVEQDT